MRFETEEIPTPTDSAISTSPYEKWTALQVISAFKAASLEVGEIRKNEPFDLAGAPHVAIEFVRFFAPGRNGNPDGGGLVFSFASQKDFDAVYNYYKELGWYDSGLYYPWVFIKDNILLQVNGILGEPEAQRYGDALQAMR